MLLLAAAEALTESRRRNMDANATPTLPLCSKAFTMICWGDYAGARAEFERAIAANPRDVNAHWNLAELLADKLKDPAAARARALTGLQIDPEHRGCKRVMASLNHEVWDADRTLHEGTAATVSALAALNANSFTGNAAIPTSRLAEALSGKLDHRSSGAGHDSLFAANASVEVSTSALADSVVLQTLRDLADVDAHTGRSRAWLVE